VTGVKEKAWEVPFGRIAAGASFAGEETLYRWLRGQASREE
jgi:hypothetical protein